jgi:sulfide dehydrogenase cytochrome subunit
MNLTIKKITYVFLRTSLLIACAGGLAMLSNAATKSEQNKPLALTGVAKAAIEKLAISGELMAHSCAACHGTLGRLGDESFMPRAGMPLRQFTTSMLDFRTGKRPATLMGHVAQGFSDAEIRAMGEFFAAVKPEGSLP